MKTSTYLTIIFLIERFTNIIWYTNTWLIVELLTVIIITSLPVVRGRRTFIMTIVAINITTTSIVIFFLSWSSLFVLWIPSSGHIIIVGIKVTLLHAVHLMISHIHHIIIESVSVVNKVNTRQVTTYKDQLYTNFW